MKLENRESYRHYPGRGCPYFVGDKPTTRVHHLRAMPPPIARFCSGRPPVLGLGPPILGRPIILGDASTETRDRATGGQGWEIADTVRQRWRPAEIPLLPLLPYLAGKHPESFGDLPDDALDTPGQSAWRYSVAPRNQYRGFESPLFAPSAFTREPVLALS